MLRLFATLLLLAAAPLLLSACGDSDPKPDPAGIGMESAWTPVAEDALDHTQKMQRKRAFEAKDTMGKALVGKLMRAMEEGGPSAAIEVCHIEAPAIAAEVGKDKGVKIGRTAHRLRSGENRPPAWAADWVAAERKENAYVAHADGSLGVLLPISLQNPCMTCHGPADAIADDVRARLAELYPDDRATGFAPGDLRGYFWIEVPTP